MKLNVFFGNKKAGSLESTENRGLIFVYDEKISRDLLNSIFDVTSKTLKSLLM